MATLNFKWRSIGMNKIMTHSLLISGYFSKSNHTWIVLLIWSNWIICISIIGFWEEDVYARLDSGLLTIDVRAMVKLNIYENKRLINDQKEYFNLRNESIVLKFMGSKT